ncbi:unnamed protein product, partial [Sphacelaria rigidula]
CDICAVGKSHQLPHPKTANNKVQRAFQLVMTDLMGSIMPEALGGFKYVCKISDENTRWTEIYLEKTNNGTLHTFQSYIQSMIILGGVRVERLRSDKGGEFIGNEFTSYCRQTGKLLDHGPVHVLDMQSPHKMLKRTEPDLNHIRVILPPKTMHVWGGGCRRKCLALKAVEGRLVGYSDDSKSYKAYNPAKQGIIESRSVVFIETPTHLTPTGEPQLRIHPFSLGDQDSSNRE